MKIEFEDKSYLEISKSQDKIIISVSAIDYNNPQKTICNSVEISNSQFYEILKSLS